jgi:CBS domain-containing protein
MNINEIMSIDVKTCMPSSNLQEVAGLMWNNDCGAIPVVNEQNIPLGIVTDRDITMAAMLNQKPLWALTASEVIKDQNLCSCQQNNSLQECLNMMKEEGVRRVIVTNADDTLAGIVSIGDVLAFTGNSISRGKKQAAQIKHEPVLSMLKHVSAHRMQPEQPIAQMKKNSE